MNKIKNKPQYDIFFLSYKESNKEKHWYQLKKRFPQSRRVCGLKGIGLAHQTCSQLSKTSFFFVVNADNEILKDFHFEINHPLKKAVYVYRSINPCKNLIYGFGAVKLFPKNTNFLFSHSIDVSSSLKVPYQVLPEIASVTHFNSSPLEAWRGAFRECAKLSSQCIHQQKSKESLSRLNLWNFKSLNTNLKKNLSAYKNNHHQYYVDLGAYQGRQYGEKYKHSKTRILKINDFDWLESFFNKNIKNKKTSTFNL